MRKKSHISLARFLIRKAGDDVLRRRWKAFYVGSLLPDCRPSFLTVRHEYDETFDMVEQKIRRLTEDSGRRPEDSMLRQELLETLTCGIASLRENEQLVISLYYQKNLSMKEIAQVMEVSEPRISQLHSRAIQKLKLYMNQYMTGRQ